MSQRDLVTGASGFVGSRLVRRLVAEGHEVHVLARPTSRLDRLGDAAAAVRVHQADLTDEAAVRAAIRRARADVIYHLATASLYGGDDLPVDTVIGVNLLGTIRLLEACEEVGFHCLINTGSSSEYGRVQEPMAETMRCEPANTYAIAKCAATQYVRLCGERLGQGVVTLRLFSPYGPGDDERRLIPYAIGRALAGESLRLADPSAVRDFVYIDDVVDAYRRCPAQADRLSGQALNVGSGQQTSVRQLVAAVLEVTGSRSEVAWGVEPPRPWESPVWQADLRAVRQTLGWAPTVTLREGLAKTVAWLQEHLTHA